MVVRELDHSNAQGARLAELLRRWVDVCWGVGGGGERGGLAELLHWWVWKRGSVGVSFRTAPPFQKKKTFQLTPTSPTQHGGRVRL